MHDEDDDDDTAEPPRDVTSLLDALATKLDTVAGATAAVATAQTDLLARLVESEGHRSEDARQVAQRLEALERQVLAMAHPADDAGGDGLPAQQHDDLTLALDVLARLAETVERSDARIEDRLAALRDAATIPVTDLQGLLLARADRSDALLHDVVRAVDGLLEDVDPARGAAATADDSPQVRAATHRLGEQVDELGEAVRALSWQLPEITNELTALREQLSGATDTLRDQVTDHTDRALVGVLRLLDERLEAMRRSITELLDAQPPAGSGPMGFEAGAVMGAAQATWNRLEQRLDTEFDDLSRQLQSMGVLIEQALQTAEAAANRPVVTGEQLRRAASVVKDSVLDASRSRRWGRGGGGGPRGLGSG